MIEAGIVVVVVLGVGFIGRKMLRDAGVIQGGDCGCGKCGTKPKRRW